MSSIQLIGATYHKNKEYILHFYNSMKDEFFRCSPDKAIKLLQDPPSAYFSRSKSCDAPAPFVNLSELMLAYFGKNESTLTSKSNVFFMITNSRHFHLKIEENQKLAKAEQEEILKQAKKREKEQEELNKKLLGNLEQKVKTITDENIRLRTEMAGPNTKRSVDNTSRPPSNQNKKRRVQSPPRQMTQPNVPTNAGQQQQPLIVSTNPGQQQQPTNVPTNAGQQLQPPIVSTNSGQHHQALVPTNAGQQQPTNVPTNAAQQQQPTNVLTDAGLRQQPMNVPTNAAQQQQPMNAPTNSAQQQQLINAPTISGQQQQQPTNAPTNSGQQQQQPTNAPTNSGQQQPTSVPTNAGQQQQLPNVPTNAGQQQQLPNVGQSTQQQLYAPSSFQPSQGWQELMAQHNAQPQLQMLLQQQWQSQQTTPCNFLPQPQQSWSPAIGHNFQQQPQPPPWSYSPYQPQFGFTHPQQYFEYHGCLQRAPSQFISREDAFRITRAALDRERLRELEKKETDQNIRNDLGLH